MSAAQTERRPQPRRSEWILCLLAVAGVLTVTPAGKALPIARSAQSEIALASSPIEPVELAAAPAKDKPVRPRITRMATRPNSLRKILGLPETPAKTAAPVEPAVTVEKPAPVKPIEVPTPITTPTPAVPCDPNKTSHDPEAPDPDADLDEVATGAETAADSPADEPESKGGQPMAVDPDDPTIWPDYGSDPEKPTADTDKPATNDQPNTKEQPATGDEPGTGESKTADEPSAGDQPDANDEPQTNDSGDESKPAPDDETVQVAKVEPTPEPVVDTGKPPVKVTIEPPLGPALALSTQQPPPAPSGTAMPRDSVVQSVVVDQQHEPINIARNQSASIELRSPLDRAEVADPKVAEIFVASPTRLVVTGRGTGSTTLTLHLGQDIRTFEVNVDTNLKFLKEIVSSISPTANIKVRSINGTVLLTGTVPDASIAEKVAALATLFEGGKVQCQLTVAGVQQTMLRVTVAEVNKTAMRQLGVNWAIGASDWSKDFFFGNNLNQLNPTVFGSTGLPDVRTGQLLYSVAPTANGVSTNLTFGFPRAEFQMFVNALRENQLFRVLAEPNLVAISGQTASFLAGGEVPIPVSQGGATAGAIVIEYKEFGVRLAFTPTVVGGQVIRLHILSEFSDAVPGTAIVGGLPAFSFTTRRVESTIECGNGQTFAIAGLLSERVQAVSSKIPGLGDIPVLGTLFQSVDYQKQNTELVILVTPELVAPLDPQQVGPPPGALMTDPDDFELFGLGQLEGRPNPEPELEGVPRNTQEVKTHVEMSKAATGVSHTLRGPCGAADAGE